MEVDLYNAYNKMMTKMAIMMMIIEVDLDTVPPTIDAQWIGRASRCFFEFSYFMRNECRRQFCL